jgi:hypothetical protein
MAIFDGTTAGDDPRQRFADIDRGGRAWREHDISRADQLHLLLEELIALRRTTPPPRTPCVFVSHRQCDEDLAKKVARHVASCGIDYWIDVADETLTWITTGAGAGSSEPVKALLIACTVEMALLNTTHLVAVMTPATAASRWVPYEYGRAKDAAMYSLEICSWLHPDLKGQPLPEYLLLADAHTDDAAVQGWLQAINPVSPHPVRVPDDWPYPPLPQ